MTIFLGCGFAAKYREGGGVLSVPLQWMLGLRRLNRDAIWLELFPGTGNEEADFAAIRNFESQLHEHGLGGRYCLFYQPDANDVHELESMRFVGISRKQLLERLAGPATLLNLSYSIHPPLLLQFERRILCDLDPSEIFYWMTKIEMGQSTHHEFWTIGLNAGAPDCRLPRTGLNWQTFFPLVDTELNQPMARPNSEKFTTIGQWYWGGMVEVDGEFPDLSKKFAFEKYIDLPKRVSGAQFELAMNIHGDDPERARLAKHGWHLVDPHEVASTARQYRQYVDSASGEFTAIKGVDVAWRTGWISDRAATFLARGRPVITEDTGAGRYLPEESGFRFVSDCDSAAEAAEQVIKEWQALSKQARSTALDVFDATKTLQKMLNR